MQVIFVLPKCSSIDVTSKQPSKLMLMHFLSVLQRNMLHNEWSNGSWIQMRSIKLPKRKSMANLFSYYYIILKSLHLQWLNLPPLSCSHFLSIMAVLYISSLLVHVSSWHWTDSFSFLSSIQEVGLESVCPLLLEYTSLCLSFCFNLSIFPHFLAWLRLSFFHNICIKNFVTDILMNVLPLSHTISKYNARKVISFRKIDLGSGKETMDWHGQLSDDGSFC